MSFWKRFLENLFCLAVILGGVVFVLALALGGLAATVLLYERVGAWTLVPTGLCWLAGLAIFITGVRPEESY